MIDLIELDKAIKDTSQLLPASASKGLDSGLDLIKQSGILPGNAFQDEIGKVFGELGLGIGASFMAALSGDDSATAVAATPETPDETTPEKTAEAQANPEGAGAAGDNKMPAPPTETPLPVAEALAANTAKDSKIAAISTAAVTGLQDALLDEDDDKNNQSAVS